MSKGDNDPLEQSYVADDAMGQPTQHEAKLSLWRHIWETISIVATWIGIALTPFGLISLVGKFYTWGEFFSYISDGWQELIRPPFEQTFGILSRFLHLPSIPPGWVDYLALGIILWSCFRRFLFLIYGDGPEEKFELKDVFWESLLFICSMIFWPLFAIGIVIIFLLCILNEIFQLIIPGHKNDPNDLLQFSLGVSFPFILVAGLLFVDKWLLG